MMISNWHTPQTTPQVKRTLEANSVGVVERHYVHFEATLNLRSGERLHGFTLAYETYGKLNEDRSNAILICHALSGDAHVAGYHTHDPNEKPGWWDEAVGPGKMFDTNRYFVICSNVLGGCQGSTGPASIAPDGKPYALRFPIITIADMVQAQKYLVDYLGIETLFATAGGSMGAMQALQWAVDYPDRVNLVLFIAATPKSSTQNIAFNEIGRQAIYADPNWNDGDYYGKTPPNAGLSVARMIGHVTYMSERSLDQKFGRHFHHSEDYKYTFDTDFEVESYFKHQGTKFTKRFDANSYLYITKALDYYDVADGYANIQEALSHVKAAFLVVSFSSDWLYTPDQALDLVTALEQTHGDVEHHLVQANFGHDSFLVEVELMTRLVGGHLDTQWQKRNTGNRPMAVTA
jgi:homoserine O-acetyltransferase/O-succinyltransferase